MANLRMMDYGNYKNKTATQNVIRYVTRTRGNEDRENELIFWSGYNVACFGDPQVAIERFSSVRQTLQRNSNPSPQLRHETLGFTDDEFRKMGEDFTRVKNIAEKCCEQYDNMGYQVIYAVHDTRALKVPDEQNNGVHIHFVINAYNYRSGNKFHESRSDYTKRRETFQQIAEQEYGKGVPALILQ